MKNIEKHSNFTALKIIAFSIGLIAAAAIIAGVPYIICNFFNLV